MGLETHAVHRGIDLGHAEDLLYLAEEVLAAEVDGLAAEATRVREPVRVQVADDHDSGA